MEHFALKAIAHNQYAFTYLSQRLQNDKKIVMTVLAQQHANRDPAKRFHWLSLPKYLPAQFLDDDDVVMEIVQFDGFFLPYASDRLRKDQKVNLAAVRQDPFALGVAEEDMKNDPSIVFAAVEKHVEKSKFNYSSVFECAGEKLRDDHDVVLRAIGKDRHAFECASDRLRNEKDIVLFAVKKDGHNLQFAGERWRKDHDVVLEAEKQNGIALMYAEGSTKDNKDIILHAVCRKYDHGYLDSASERLKDDKTVVLAVVHYNGYHYWRDISKRLKGDFQVAITAVANDPWVWSFLLLELKKNKEIALACIANAKTLDLSFSNSRNARNFSEVLDDMMVWFKNDREVMEALIEWNWLSIKYASCDLKLYPELVLFSLHTMQSSSYETSDEYFTVFDELFIHLRKINTLLVAQSDRLLDVFIYCGKFEPKEKYSFIGKRSDSGNEAERKRMKLSRPHINSRQWCRSQWERVWLVAKLIPVHRPDIKSSLPPDVLRNIIELAGFQKTTQLCGDVEKWAPVVNRFSELGLMIPSELWEYRRQVHFLLTSRNRRAS